MFLSSEFCYLSSYVYLIFVQTTVRTNLHKIIFTVMNQHQKSLVFSFSLVQEQHLGLVYEG